MTGKALLIIILLKTKIGIGVGQARDELDDPRALSFARCVTYFLPSGLSVASHEGFPNVTLTIQGLVATSN